MTRKSHPDLEVAVDQALAFFLVPEPLAENRLLELIHVLDRLALAIHPIDPEASPEDVPDSAAPRVAREQIAARFPMLGLYSVQLPPDSSDSEEALLPNHGIGDAIDDLLDIANDLHRANWLRENAEFPAWRSSVQFTYRMHWGRHLRELQGYLHGLAF